jgi:hypothetical protein
MLAFAEGRGWPICLHGGDAVDAAAAVERCPQGVAVDQLSGGRMALGVGLGDTGEAITAWTSGSRSSSGRRRGSVPAARLEAAA